MIALTDTLTGPYVWAALVIIAHTAMLMIFVRGLREDAREMGRIDGWNAAREAMAERQRQEHASKRLPLLNPEPDCEDLVLWEQSPWLGNQGPS